MNDPNELLKFDSEMRLQEKDYSLYSKSYTISVSHKLVK